MIEPRAPASQEEDGRLASLVVAGVNAAVLDLVRMARVHHCVRPQAAAHIQRLAERIAGETVDAIQSWPSA